ncbi:MAG: SRPBCC domain-containing protein [Bacteroidota bacterium]|jgi:uncharacterized protein YndB with AHSA1/START domain
MKNPSYIKNSIGINASIHTIWDVLVNPEKTKRYMYGCETVSDWKAGSDLLWKGNDGGKETVFVKGKIISLEESKKLTYTVFDPHSTMEDIPENYLTVSYELATVDNETVLTVTQGNYHNVADGERRYKEAYNNGQGWNPILIQIKQIAESLQND